MIRTVLGLGCRSLAIVYACAAVLACATTTAPPTNCWIALRGEYHLDGPPDAAIAGAEAAAEVVHARLSRMGLAQFAVLVPRDGIIEVDLPFMADTTVARELIRPAGDISFVPIPNGVSVENGDQIPSDLMPLFGRDGILSVQPSIPAEGQSAIDIQLVQGATHVFADYSRRSVGSQFAIAIDGVVFSAPVIQQPIADGRMQISGLASEQESNRLAAILSLPPLPAPLTEISFGPFTPPASCAAAQ